MAAGRKIKTARSLRQRETDLEAQLWRELRNRRAFGLKFRRQHPVGPFVVDFACIEAMLIVEIDGYWHAIRRDKDERRTDYLKEQGYDVVRFDVETEGANVDELVQAITHEAKVRIGR